MEQFLEQSGHGKYPYEKVQPVSPRVLSLVVKILTPFKLGPKKIVSVIAFRNLMSKLDGLVVRWLFVSTNGIKMQILGVVGFKSSTLTDYCLSS